VFDVAFIKGFLRGGIFAALFFIIKGTVLLKEKGDRFFLIFFKIIHYTAISP